MSNSVSRFIGHSSSTGYNSYFLLADSLEVVCSISFCSFSSDKSSATLYISLPDSPLDFNSINLSRDQITRLLSLDCPDAFIAYALTLCPCPPETLSCATKCDLDEVDGASSLIPSGYKSLEISNGFINNCYQCKQDFYSCSSSIINTCPSCEDDDIPDIFKNQLMVFESCAVCKNSITQSNFNSDLHVCNSCLDEFKNYDYSKSTNKGA